MLRYTHKSPLHCTAGDLRWDGTVHRRNARAGQYPRHADCSFVRDVVSMEMGCPWA
jgi:hypothetical protein